MKLSDLIEWFARDELVVIRDEAGWSQRRLGDAIGKHENTIGGWERGVRLPDAGNVSLICAKLGVDAARAGFLLHVIEQLNQGPAIVSDLDKRNLFIVESAERKYGEVVKWDPLLFPSLLQTEPYHMKALAEPLDGPAAKIRSWKRKERRIADFFGRKDTPTAKFLVPALVIADLGSLSVEERAGQFEWLLHVDSLPHCEVRVVAGAHEAINGFDMFRSDGRRNGGPDFVYVDSIDQSRHIVEPEKLALYDQVLSVLWDDAIRIGRYLDERVHPLAEEQSE